MKQILNSQPDCNGHREFMLHALRCGRIRVDLFKAEIDEIGTALKHNLITAEAAASWLGHAGLLQFVNVDPFANKVAIDKAAA